MKVLSTHNPQCQLYQVNTLQLLLKTMRAKGLQEAQKDSQIKS